MFKFDSRYMIDTPWSGQYLKLAGTDFAAEKEPFAVEVKNGTILPTSAESATKDIPWGLGGVIDSEGNYLPISGVKGGFGGKYDYDPEKIQVRDEEVVFIGIIPKHWGHFLIDSICRLWYLLESDFKGKIVFCGCMWKEPEISGNFSEMFRLLGLDLSRLEYMTEPARFRKVIIPSFTMSFETSYHSKFKDVVRKATEAAVAIGKEKKLPQYEKIYFTRREFPGAQKREIGEKEIEQCFRESGFQVFAPEKLSLVEQIYYIHSCRQMASLSGTIPHNAIFGSEGMKLIILNRTCEPNMPQILLNKLFDIDCTYVDCFTQWTIRHAKPYGQGVIWIGVTDCLKNYLGNNGYVFTEDNVRKRFTLVFMQWIKVQQFHLEYCAREIARPVKKWIKSILLRC